MNRLLCAAAIAWVLAPSIVQAQVSPPPPGQEPAATTERFSGSATVGISVESGRTDLSGIQISLLGKRPYSEFSGLIMSLDYSHATTQPPGESERVTVADRLAASFEVG